MDSNSLPSNRGAGNHNAGSSQSNRRAAGEPQSNRPPAGIAFAIVGGNNAADEEINHEERPVVGANAPAQPNRGKSYILGIYLTSKDNITFNYFSFCCNLENFRIPFL